MSDRICHLTNEYISPIFTFAYKYKTSCPSNATPFEYMWSLGRSLRVCLYTCKTYDSSYMYVHLLYTCIHTGILMCISCKTGASHVQLSKYTCEQGLPLSTHECALWDYDINSKTGGIQHQRSGLLCSKPCQHVEKLSDMTKFNFDTKRLLFEIP